MRTSTLALFAALAMLGSGPAAGDPVAERAQARALVAAENWPAAAAAYRALTSADPDAGADWYYLGAALARSGNCADARPALDRAIALGVNGARSGLRRAHVDAAGCAATIGDADEALRHLAIAQARYGFELGRLAQDQRFATLIRDPRFRRLAGDIDRAGLGRVAGWQGDIDFYTDLMLRRHPNPFHSVDEAQWRRSAAELRAQIPHLTDAEVVESFMRLSTLIGDGHTSMAPPMEGPMAFHLLPIWPYAFGNEWYVMAAAPDHAELVGARIVGMNGRPMAEIVARLRTVLAHDNDVTFSWLGAMALQFAETAALGAGSESSSEVNLDVEGSDGTRRSARLVGGPIDRDPSERWAPAAWPSMGAPAPPPWLARAEEPYWLQDMERGDLVFAQINQIGGEGETFAQFVAELGQRLRSGRARRLVIDLRHNNGGDGSPNWSLVREIVRSPRIDHEGGLFVIVGRRTFSAAMNLASMLETHTDAIFVGEPTGSRPNFYGEDTPFTLPYSRMTGSISSAWFQGGATSDDIRPWIAPGLPAPLTPADLRAGRDPALAAILAYRGQ
jgi:hypothetical protein